MNHAHIYVIGDRGLGKCRVGKCKAVKAHENWRAPFEYTDRSTWNSLGWNGLRLPAREDEGFDV